MLSESTLIVLYSTSSIVIAVLAALFIFRLSVGFRKDYATPRLVLISSILIAEIALVVTVTGYVFRSFEKSFEVSDPRYFGLIFGLGAFILTVIIFVLSWRRIKIGRFPITNGVLVHVHWTWWLTVGLSRADDPAASDHNCDIWVSLKVNGPAYVKGSKAENSVWLDRVILIKAAESE